MFNHIKPPQNYRFLQMTQAGQGSHSHQTASLSKVSLLGSPMSSSTWMTMLLAVFVMSNVVEYASSQDLFTSTAHMKDLLGLESELLAGLNLYVTAEKARLQRLESLVDEVADIHRLMDDADPTSHLHNPVNSLQLISRFTNQWRYLPHLILHDTSMEHLANVSGNLHHIPTQEDLDGAMRAVMRLQDTYDLQPGEIASGNLSKEQSLTMNALDCYNVGRLAYEDKNWNKVIEWLKEALQKSSDGSGVDLVTAYELLSFAEFSLGNMKKAATYTEELLKIAPDHERSLEYMDYFNNLKEKSPDSFIDAELLHYEDDKLNWTERKNYEQICREGRPYPPEMLRKLTCYYYNGGNNPRLIIQPVKVEVVYLDPNIYIIRDILTDREMERLKEQALPEMKQAAVTDSDKIKVYSNYRIGKIAWLNSSDDNQGYLSKIDQRIQDFTGMSMETAENFQVCNYGIGGHFEPHFDYLGNNYAKLSSILAADYGDRIATLLIYLSDVERGGATAFTELGLRIAPSKGDAAFWWNLKKSGEGDCRTKHAGCPVLVGSKWVCNRWIHERGQEFKRPCDLNKDL